MMDRERVQEVMGRMDPALIERMDPPKKRRLPRPLRTGLIAACVCLALIGTAVAVQTLPMLTVTETWSAVRPNGKIFSSYTIQDGFTKLSLDALSDEARAFASEQMSLPATKGCESWTQVEEFLGIEVADNPVLEQFEPTTFSFDSPGDSPESYHAAAVIYGHCDAPTFIDLLANYFLTSPHKDEAAFGLGTGIHVSATLFFDSPYSHVTDAPRTYSSEGSSLAATETYVTPSGLEAVIAAQPSGNVTFYRAHFTLNGARFEVEAFNVNDSDLALKILKQVLDGYQ